MPANMGTKPVCPRCKLFFQPKKSGTYFEEGMPIGGGLWGPYKLWSGDLWACRGCGAEVIVGLPARPIAEHFEDEYAKSVELFPPLCRVEDC